MSEWAFSSDRDRVNEFIELMLYALKAKLRPMGVAYFRDGEHYYFTATPDLKPKRVEYKSFRKNATRTVFQGFPSKDDPTHMRFYRHVAFQPQFFSFEKAWYLAISPTYHFTFDGTHERGEWSLEPNRDAVTRIVEGHRRLFGALG